MDSDGGLGFPLWLRITHFINLFCIFLLMRSGVQILADHPKLYWNDHSTPGSEWIKFGKKQMPPDRLWTSMDEAEHVNPVIALPGGHHNLGAGRHWHFLTVLVWILNGLSYVTLLFVTGQWRRLVPTSWDILPRAWHSVLTFATFHIPPLSEFHPYDPLQQLTYAAVVFLIAPMMIATGLCMSPALIARFPWYPRLFGGRQVARSLHFIGLILLVLYTVVHITLVFSVYFLRNVGHMVFGDPTPASGVAIAIFLLGILGLIVFHIAATLYTRRYPQQFQRAATRILEPVVRAFFGGLESRQAYRASERSPQFRVNGYPPVSEEYQALARDHWNGWRLTIEGLVERPLELSMDDLRALPKERQTTKHNCIQGWSGVAEWGGVPMRTIIDLCRPLPHVRWVVFYAFQQEEYAPRCYYEVLTREDVMQPQTILAYEMNGAPLPPHYGAPCRLRIETKLGYKMVKYLRAIAFVDDVRKVGEGMGGYREDYQYYDNVAVI